MGNVGLLYVGAVLFINGLMLLGRVETKSAGIFNLFVGVMQVLFPFYALITAQDQSTIFQASGIFLFGFTYLLVGICNLKGYSGTALGWYSLWVAIMAIAYSLINFSQFGDFKFGIIWLLWSYLWFLFFLQLALGKDIGTYTGWVAIIQSWTTATIPAFLSLIGLWEHVNGMMTGIVTVVVLLSFIFLYQRTTSRNNSKQASY
ncbi:transporter [Ammoniphilus sp. CFH 90114]|nr:transporter [Ammoniphilus sp. CFH 90114]